jgi:signal transduction histidine kinase
MRLVELLSDLRPRRLPRRSLRLRLTALYGALFLASGAGLLTVTYLLVRNRYTSGFFIESASQGRKQSITITGLGGAGPILTPPSGGFVTKQELAAQAAHQSTAALHQLVLNSGIALAIMAVVSIWLGWLVAGRALRPLRTITNAARDISASNLHKRLGLQGPDDELTQLANTFDDLLGRLEAAFDAQRQFVANASHELRTPLTLERTLVEVALADPNATAETLRATCERVLAAGEQQEKLIEALLTLSRSQRGLDRHEAFDLASVTADVLIARQPEAERRQLRLDATLGAAPVSGDVRLAERLITNLIDNAVRHNNAGGQIEITTTSRAGSSTLSVSNSGQIIPPDETDRLLQPFQRLASDRNSNDDGLGLGLSIVHAIAAAHGATLTARAQPHGGLHMEVSFPTPGHLTPDAASGPSERQTSPQPEAAPAGAVTTRTSVIGAGP